MTSGYLLMSFYTTTQKTHLFFTNCPFSCIELSLNMPTEVPIKLSKWIKWENKPEIEFPGVYLLGLFEEAPTETNPTDERIVYIGETCENYLTKRWNNFDKSALTGLRAHCGGRSFYKEFGSLKNNQLYVCYFTTESSDNNDIRSAIIRYVERKLILDYALKWKRLPVCNKK